jgi:hypothetical protein
MIAGTPMNRITLLAVALSGACASQVDGDHQGAVLATLEGTVHAPRMMTTKADVSLVWVYGRAGIGLIGKDPIEVEGELPSSFTISVFSRPADDMMRAWDGERAGGAYIVAHHKGTDAKDWDNWLGVDYEHVVIYVPEAAEPGSAIAGLLRSTPEAGFHIYNVRKATEAEYRAQLDCWNRLYQQTGETPSVAEQFAQCGGDSHDPLTSSDLDLDTQLGIEILDHPFGVVEINKLPRWYAI